MPSMLKKGRDGVLVYQFGFYVIRPSHEDSQVPCENSEVF